jgi:hypothetical protein
MKRQCKDCSLETDYPTRGWQWIDLVEPESKDTECNGWRCPQCTAGWDEIIESWRETRH